MDDTPPRTRPARVVRRGTWSAGHNTSRHADVPPPGLRPPVRRAPEGRPIPAETRELILRLLGERVALRAIARVTGVSRSWLQRFANGLYRDEAGWRVEPPPATAAEKSAAW